MPIKTALPLSLIWLLSPMPGWEPAHCPACFPFPTFQRILDLISFFPEIGAHKHDRFVLKSPGELGQNFPNGTRRSVGATRSFSFGFIFPSSVHTARYLEILPYLNVNHSLAGEQVRPRLLCIKNLLFSFFSFFFTPLFCLPEGISKPGLK